MESLILKNIYKILGIRLNKPIQILTNVEDNERVMSYLEFKVNKEINYEDTFEKDDKVKKEYTEYLNNMERRKNNGKSK